MISLNNQPIRLASLIVEDIRTVDYPDFSDAFFSSGSYENGVELSEDELDRLAEDCPCLLNELAHEQWREEQCHKAELAADWERRP